tara:strand:+ start:56012 stop:57430 length:1419 start_codon:yes stop_codon:yes gene_type:complete
MRCLTLGHAMDRQGWRVSIALNETAAAQLPNAKPFNYNAIVLSDDQLRSNADLKKATGEGCRLAVVDDYESDEAFEADLAAWAENILVIDDLADKAHRCRYLLDTSPARKDTDYRGLIPSDCLVMAGPAFALIRDEFNHQRSAALRRRPAVRSIARVLISFGLTDAANMTAKVLKAIQNTGRDLEIDVVLGNAAPHWAEISGIVDAMGESVTLHRNPKNFPELAVEADIAFGAPGVSSLERCCLGLPTITVPVADNQKTNARGLAEVGAIQLLDQTASESDLGNALRNMIGDVERVRMMSDAAFSICDGRGAARTFLAVSPEPTKGPLPLSSRPATTADTDTVYRWQSAPGSRTYSRNPKVPGYEEHRAWMASRLMPQAGLFEIMTMGKAPVGMVRLDLESDAVGTYEVSILIAPEMRGQGIGRAALAAARRLVPEGTFLATIHPDNAPSRKIFSAAGYIPENSRFISRPTP